MSHPLVVEAAESLFVPMLVHNNRSGVDQKILKRFGEPAWNNPVIRFVDKNEKDVIARRDGIWTTSGVVSRMIAALQSQKVAVPDYLRIVAAEEDSREETATFAMYCFWQGEVDLGGLPGVKRTEAAWLHGKEVVEVVFDPRVVSYEKLVQTAQNLKCASTVFARNEAQFRVAKRLVGRDAELTRDAIRPAKQSDRKFYLNRTALRYLPLTPMQATKVNAALLNRQSYNSLLSPRQKQLLTKVTAVKDDAKIVRQLQSLNRPNDVKMLAEYEEKLAAIFE